MPTPRRMFLSLEAFKKERHLKARPGSMVIDLALTTTTTVKQTGSEHSHLGDRISENHMLACVHASLPVMQGGKHRFTGGVKSTLKPRVFQRDPNRRDTLVPQFDGFQANLPAQ